MRIPDVPRRQHNPLAALLAVVFALAPGPSSERSRRPDTSATELPAIRLQRPAPDFGFDVGGGARRLADARGHVVLVNFWDTWCHPCVDEIPALADFARTHPDVEIVTISDERAGIAREFLRSKNVTLPVAEDPARAVFGRYSVVAIPATVMVRPDGIVAAVQVGQADAAVLERALALAQAP